MSGDLGLHFCGPAIYWSTIFVGPEERQERDRSNHKIRRIGQNEGRLLGGEEEGRLE
jgi:hypothetical protein